MSDNMITVNIDGKDCIAKEGEYILNVARANDIFVPALCYVTRCSPTLACRVCLVEADGKQVYSCNAKVKDGMQVTTTTENIAKEREAIMEVYDVNHPLQCGVCDQSGECELQNYTLYMGVNKQSYAVKDVNRPTVNWGVMNYDPGLCIVCEKCTTVCKDMIGSNALSTVKRGADALDKTYKENMPKDAYAMWNKLNKNLIGFEEEKCIDCGECIAVCPVGALVSNDFQYTSNAWELTKIPASNPYSSDCSLMYYETKAISIENPFEKKIYRVTNDSHYTSLSGAARFAFDYSNTVENKNEEEFKKAVDALKNANTVLFNSFITNEEATILQRLKAKLGFNLVNKDAKAYQNFLNNFASVSGKTLYNGTLKDIHNSNFLISVGTYFKSDAPNVRYAFNNAITLNKGAGLYFHPMIDTSVEGFGKAGKTIKSIANKALSEEAVLYFVLDQFAKDLPSEIQAYLDTFKETRTKTVTETIKETVVTIVKDEQTGEEKEVKKVVPKKVKKEVEFTYTKLLDIIGSDESLLSTIEDMLAKKDTYSLVVGADLYTHPQSANLAKLCAMIEKYTQFKVVIIPSQTNTLGVSQLCTLDDEIVGNTFGYNTKADYEISALGDANLDMPCLNQQEGTFVNINKTLVPTNAALSYNGYTLNDIANEILDNKKENTIDYTSEIFNNIAFDDLENFFANDQTEHRGYTISPSDIAWKEVLSKISIANIEGSIIYNANPINQFNEFSAMSKEFKNEIVALYVSNSMLESLDIKENDKVNIETSSGNIQLDVKVDNQLDGNIGYVPTFDKKIDTKALFESYRFTNANIKKV
jgi:NADH-quinone oxidoreductase subunit G